MTDTLPNVRRCYVSPANECQRLLIKPNQVTSHHESSVNHPYFLAVLLVRGADTQPFPSIPFKLELPRPGGEGIRIFSRPAPNINSSLALQRTPSPLAEKQQFVPRTFYPNRPKEVGKDGRRAADILHDNEIDFIFADSTGVMMAVPVGSAPKALRLLAAAIQAEHLQLTLVKMGPQNDWGNVVTSESILDPKRTP